MNWSKRVFLVTAVSLFMVSCGQAIEEDQPIDLSTLTIGHPLVGVDLVDGKVPGVDIFNSPKTGNRYAYGEITSNFGNGTIHKSGIFELKRHDLSEDTKYLRLKEAEIDGFVDSPKELFKHRFLTSKPKVKTRLQKKIDSMDNNEFIVASIRIKDDYVSETLFKSIDREIGLGKIKTESDYRAKKSKFLLDRKHHFDDLKKEVIKWLNDKGYVYKTPGNLLKVLAKVKKSDLFELSLMESVYSIDYTLESEINDDYRTSCILNPSWLDSNVNGEEVSQGVQLQQFLCSANNFEGEVPSGPYRVAIIEGGVSHWNNGRFDWNQSNSRWISRRACSSWFGCSNADVDNKTAHATAVTGLIAGDLTQNQDPNWTTEQSQVALSGYAPEVEVLSYAESNAGSFENAVDEIINSSPRPLVANMSMYTISGDHLLHDCNGDWDEDEATNALYEAGILPVKSAGNVPSDNNTSCTVSIPGSAIGAFVVGGYTASGGINGVRNGPIYSFSSRGSLWRTIVDIVAPSNRTDMADSSGGWNKDNFQGTSFSTPTVSAAILDFSDFYETTFNSVWIKNPGAMTSSMLLMGDRTIGINTNNNSSIQSTSRFDALWGSGRMMMRMFNNQGMDAPWQYGRFETCVSQGEVYTYTMFVPSSVDALKIVANWYDRRHDTGSQPLDDIDLQIEIRDMNGNYINSRTSQSSYDEKERIFYDMSTINTDSNVTIKIIGYNVTADNEGCGTNSNNVYFAWYFEDEARDDASDGPGSEILTGR